MTVQSHIRIYQIHHHQADSIGKAAAQMNYVELGQVEDADVVGDGADNDSGLGGTAWLLHLSDLESTS